MNGHRVRESSGHTAAGVGTGRAHGKAILVGEHTVVHGTPAIAFPLPALSVCAVARPGESGYSSEVSAGGQFRFAAGDTPASADALSGPRVAVEQALRQWGVAGEVVDVVLDCDIPPARGLGSSAAAAGAAVRAVADLYGRTVDSESLYDLVQFGEQFAHGRASGVDASAALATGPIWFQAGVARPLDIGLDAALVIADTGTAGATQHAVAAVRRRLDGDPQGAQRLLDRAAELTRSAAADLAAGHAESLGKTLLEFQDLLDQLGVSTPQIDTLIKAALDAGSLGAKLTGAGLGGCVLALTHEGSDASQVSAALRQAGAVQTWIVPTRGRQL